MSNAKQATTWGAKRGSVRTSACGRFEAMSSDDWRRTWTVFDVSRRDEFGMASVVMESAKTLAHAARVCDQWAARS